MSDGIGGQVFAPAPALGKEAVVLVVGHAVRAVGHVGLQPRRVGQRRPKVDGLRAARLRGERRRRRIQPLVEPGHAVPGGREAGKEGRREGVGVRAG
eukprot:SAG22_NODE_2494_length_2512_cov_2.110651_2_plen_97_part_00